MLATASLGEDAALLDLLVETAKGAFERLVLTNSDFSQSSDHLPRPWFVSVVAAGRGRDGSIGPDTDARLEGSRSLAEAPVRVKPTMGYEIEPSESTTARHHAPATTPEAPAKVK